MRESKKVKIGLCHFILKLFSRQSRASKEKRQALASEPFTRILVYSTTALGDYMFNSPALRAIRLRYPTAHITLVAHPKYASLLTRRDYYDDVLFWNNKVNSLRALLKQTKPLQPQLAVLLHSHMPYDIMSAALSGCQFIVRDNYAKPMGKMAHWLVYGLDHYDAHVIARKMKLVSALGCATDNVDMALPCEYVLAEKPAGTRRIGFQLGASTRIRCWPPEYYAQLASRLVASDANLDIVLIGSTEEIHLAESLLAQVDPAVAKKITSYVGKTTLPQLLGVIGSMDVLVTGDTGPFHLAIALKVATLSLFATEDPRRSGPYQDRQIHRQIYLPLTDPRVTDQHEPLRAVSTGEVFAQVSEMLNS